MICVLSLFGETDFQPVLKKDLQPENIFFIEENCITSVQLTEQVENRCREVDAVIIYSNAINMDILGEYVKELRGFAEHLRIILILKGTRKLFLRSQINEYHSWKLDLIFDEDGFDIYELIDFLKKGKLSNKELKTEKKKSGFDENINGKESDDATNKRSASDWFFKPGNLDEEENIVKEKEERKSFAEPQGHFTVGIMNATRGAGATWTANNLARYFAMHKYSVCIVDFSLTDAIKMMKLKNIDTYIDVDNIAMLQGRYNVTIIDYGTPLEISPDGKEFKYMNLSKPETIHSFTDCDIKLIMGFSDSWNIEKINFFFTNDAWNRLFDDSYLFIIDKNADKVKKLFPSGNIFNREDDFRELINEAFRKEED